MTRAPANEGTAQVKRLLLVGGGHAHLEVLRAIRRRPIPGTEVILVSPGRHAAYTGMVPGFLAHRYAAADIRFDLDALATAAGGTYVNDSVASVDGRARVAKLSAGEISFDACSIDVGSAPVGIDVPGVREHALPLRPLSNAMSLAERFDALAAEERPTARCVIVGGGAAGVEVAIALAGRAGGRVQLSIVDEARDLLPEAPERARRIAAMACRREGVAVVLGARVAMVSSASVKLANGAELPSDMTVWLTGAAPVPLLAASPIPRCAAGYLAVDDTLRAVDGTPVWGAGDCITLRDHPWVPKAGVYAVREAPVLARNLRMFLECVGHAAAYRPQAAYLSLLSTSDRRALLVYRGVAFESRWGAWLKGRIDRRFMKRYRLQEPAGTVSLRRD